MSRYIITVNRDAIDKGDPNPIRAENTKTGTVSHHDYLVLLGRGNAVVRSGPPRRDGARVWIEAEDVVGTTFNRPEWADWFQSEDEANDWLEFDADEDERELRAYREPDHFAEWLRWRDEWA